MRSDSRERNQVLTKPSGDRESKSLPPHNYFAETTFSHFFFFADLFVNRVWQKKINYSRGVVSPIFLPNSVQSFNKEKTSEEKCHSGRRRRRKEKPNKPIVWQRPQDLEERPFCLLEISQRVEAWFQAFLSCAGVMAQCEWALGGLVPQWFKPWEGMLKLNPLNWREEFLNKWKLRVGFRIWVFFLSLSVSLSDFI